MRIRLAGCVFVIAAALAAAAPATAQTYPTGFSDRVLASGLGAPTAVAWTPDGRMLIADKEGRVDAVPPGGGAATEVIDITSRVNTASDRGLLGLAVDPDYATNNYVYLVYTYELAPLTPDGDGPMVSRLERFTLSPGNVAVADDVLLGSYDAGPCPTARDDLDCIPSDDVSHSIGTVRADADGTLWVGSGDAASFGFADPLALRTYDEKSMAGKILHVDRDGRGLPGHSFCPANGNLDDVCSKVHAKGFRNPSRFSIRPGGRGLFVGDVGWNQYEEIDLVAAGGGNYGWPCREAGQRTPGYRDWPECVAEYAKDGTPQGHRPPAYEYLHSVGSTVIAGPTYSGGPYPSTIDGDAFYGDYTAGTIRRVQIDEQDRVTGTVDFATDWEGLVGLEQAPNGNLVAIDIGTFNSDGTIREIVYENTDPTARASATPTSGPTPLSVDFTGSTSSDPDDEELTYDWDFGDGSAHSSAVNPTHEYTSAGTFQAGLTVTDAQNNSHTATVEIQPGGAAPTVAIEAPADGSLYRGGSEITVRGSATDAQDGDLPASALEWRVLLHHGNHIHSLHQAAGTAETSFTAGIDHDADSYFEVRLTARDSGGLSGSRSITLRPETKRARITSVPSGAPVSYGGRDFIAPVNEPTAIGFRTTLSASATFTRDGRPFHFQGWSDDGPRVRAAITVPPSGLDLRATYRENKGFARAATASSAQTAGLDANQAVDGDPDTRWSSAFQNGQHWQVDLGSARRVDEVQLDWEAAYALRYEIQTSADGTTWSTAASQTLPAGQPPGTVSTPFAVRTARYVRVQTFERATQFGVSFWEARVLGPADADVLPETSITSGPPAAIAERDTSFGFASEQGATFECRLDAGDWEPCTSPHAVSGLPDGQHQFAVRALNDAGEDPTPADRSVRVDTQPPATQITSGPTATVAEREASVKFTSDADATFECRLDAADWESCSSPYTARDLAEGPHTIEVRATDAAGNVESAPALRSFSVELPRDKRGAVLGEPRDGRVAYSGLVLRTKAVRALFGLGDAGRFAANAAPGPRGRYRGAPRRGSALVIGGRDGRSRTFDGRNDRLDIPPRVLGSPRALSMEMWVRRARGPRGTGVLVAAVDSRRRNGITLALDRRNRPIVWLNGPTGSKPVRLVGAPLGRGVHHLVATYDGARLAIYVDASPRRSKRLKSRIRWRGRRRLLVGGDGRRRSLFKGTIDELSLYGRALPASTVREHFRAGR